MKPFALCLGLSLLMASHVSAARAPDDPNEADHVIIGKVEKVFTRQVGRMTEFIVQIRVHTIEKGTGYKPQDVMHVYCYQRKPEVFAVADDPGHKAIPKEGQTIKAVVHLRKTGILEGNFPSWFEEELVESEILKTELKTLIDDMVKAGKPLPPGFDAKRFIEQTRKSDPDFLRVSVDVEAQWKRNQFDEAGAGERIKAAVRVFQEFDVEIPAMNGILVKQYDSGKLKGARLELAAQLLDAEVESLKKKLTRE